MDKWEYKFIYVNAILSKSNTGKYEQEMNAVGDQGWELVCSVNQVLFFKRKIN